MAWLKTQPTGSTAIQSSDQLIRDNWAAIEDGDVPFDLLQIDNATADAPMYFKENGTTKWVMGNDYSATNGFALSSGTTLGTSNVMEVDAAGHIAFPLQSAFQARLTSTVSNVTGDGTVYTVIYDTETYDRNADFNTGTGVYTAPIASLCNFTTLNRVIGVTSTHTDGRQSLNTSNRLYPEFHGNIYASATPGGAYAVTSGWIADMDAADTAHIEIYAGGSSKVIDIQGNASDGRTVFCGWLLG